MSEKLVIVGRDKKSINCVCDQVKKINPNLELEVLTSLESIVSDSEEHTTYKGFMIDFKSMIGCSSAHKVLSAVVEDLFPTAKFKINSDGSVGIVGSSYADNLNSFINEDVKSFGARTVRRHERTKQHLPLKFSLDEGKTWEESFSEDVSLGGIYLLTNKRLSVGSSLMIEFTGSEEKRNAVVRWTVNEGSSKKSAGSGLEFV